MIQEVLKRIDRNLNIQRPSTMDDLLQIVHTTTGVEKYGTHFSIVRYKGYLQGVRVYVIGRSKTHVLPAKDKVYSVFQGVDKYEKAGFTVENEID